MKEELTIAAEAGVLQAGHLVVLQEFCAFEAPCWLDGGNRPKADLGAYTLGDLRRIIYIAFLEPTPLRLLTIRKVLIQMPCQSFLQRAQH